MTEISALNAPSFERRRALVLMLSEGLAPLLPKMGLAAVQQVMARLRLSNSALCGSSFKSTP